MFHFSLFALSPNGLQIENCYIKIQLLLNKKVVISSARCVQPQGKFSLIFQEIPYITSEIYIIRDAIYHKHTFSLL